MQSFDPHDPNYASRVQESFARQAVMRTIGAELSNVASGHVQIRLPYRDDLTQQDGYLHAGIITTIVDSACGYAAFSLMPPDAAVLTIEYKVNFLAPAVGEEFVATGRVSKPGRTLTVCHGDVVAVAGGDEKRIATILATMMTL